MHTMLLLASFNLLNLETCFQAVPGCFSNSAVQHHFEPPHCTEACRGKLFSSIEQAFVHDNWVGFLNEVFLFDDTGNDVFLGLPEDGANTTAEEIEGLHQKSIILIAPLSGVDSVKFICFVGTTAPTSTLVFTVDADLKVEPVKLKIDPGHNLSNVGIGAIYGVERNSGDFYLYERAPQGVKYGDPYLKGRIFKLNLDTKFTLTTVERVPHGGANDQ